MKHEDGINAGARNIGRFFLSLIPWALAVGALAWMATWISFHEWRRELRQEQRSAVYVSAPLPLKTKIKITVLRKSCVSVERADLDGTSLIVYAKAPLDCGNSGLEGYALWHWQEVSPDGTVIHNGEDNKRDILAGEKAESRFTIPSDDRTAEVRVWIDR